MSCVLLLVTWGKKDFLEKWAIIQLSFQTTNWISSFLLFQPCFYKVRSRNWLFLVWRSFMNLRLSFVTWKKAVFFFLENKQLCSEVLNMIRGKYVAAFSPMFQEEIGIFWNFYFWNVLYVMLSKIWLHSSDFHRSWSSVFMYMVVVVRRRCGGGPSSSIGWSSGRNASYVSYSIQFG